jgi:5-methylcytosine-specific restriction endonuclease McrA
MYKRFDKKAYYEYLQSYDWRKKRKIALEFYGRNCCLCGSTHSIQVHHRNYKNLFKENMEDLILLCESCHRNFHKKKIMKNGKQSKYMKHPAADTNTVTYFPGRNKFEYELYKKYMKEGRE